MLGKFKVIPTYLCIEFVGIFDEKVSCSRLCKAMFSFSVFCLFLWQIVSAIVRQDLDSCIY